MLWFVLSQRPAWQRTSLTIAVLVVVLCLAWTGPANLVEVAPRPVDEWLASQPGRDPMMQFRLEAALSGPSMLYTRYHGKPVVFAYGTFYEFAFRETYPELATFPDDAALDTLESWGVRWVLVALDFEAPYALEDVNAQPRLQYVTTLGGQAVYEFPR